MVKQWKESKEIKREKKTTQGEREHTSKETLQLFPSVLAAFRLPIHCF